MIVFIPVERAEISAEWIAERRAVVQRDGLALRGGTCARGYTIELKSQRTREELAVPGFRPLNAWNPIGWHLGALCFATAAERDAVLAQLREAP